MRLERERGLRRCRARARRARLQLPRGLLDEASDDLRGGLPRPDSTDGNDRHRPSLNGVNGSLVHHHGPFNHSHHHHGPHRHARLPFRSTDPGDHHHGEHGHIHGLVDPSIIRSRAGVRAVSISLAVLATTAALQAVVFLGSGSVALLADLIHNAGDALTAIPLGMAFLLRSKRGERWAGYAVVVVIFISAAVAGIEAIDRLIHPQALDYLGALALAGAIGFVGNEIAAQIRLRAGARLQSPALIADGHHARVDGFVSLGVIASAGAVWVGLDRSDPLIGLAITIVILRITWQAWRTIRGDTG
jgi:Co/Zn/Cd efflux system component